MWFAIVELKSKVNGTVNDCQFGVSPVNNSDSDSEPSQLGIVLIRPRVTRWG